MLALLCAAPLAGCLAACGATTSVSTSRFKGEQQQVAQTIAHLQSHATALEAKKICTEDLAAALVARLDKSPGGCKQAIESQLKQVDDFNSTVELVWIEGNTAGAHVKSIALGKNRLYTLAFIREGGKWRITGIA
jgi:hypothetical protein